MYTELLAVYDVTRLPLINDAIFESKMTRWLLEVMWSSIVCANTTCCPMGRVHVAYIPVGKCLGLSKIPSIVDMFARRLQVRNA